jgi:signal transduction histidine kinase
MAFDKSIHINSKYFLLVFIMLSFTGAGWLFSVSRMVPSVLLLVSGIIGGILLIRLYNETNKAVAYFFNALRNEDTAIQFQTPFNNPSLQLVYESMNRLNRHFQDIRLQGESNEKYYKTLIQHAATGILVLDENNHVKLINEMACKYAGISYESTNLELLKIKNKAFYDALCNLMPGEDITYKNIIGNEFQLLLFHATYIKRNNSLAKLISIQDIRQELESKELESYRKLISVLTHEIMNLLSPLTSVSKALYASFLRDNHPKEMADLKDSDLKSAINSLQVIDEQSTGLISFVNNYRKISKIPQPEIKAFAIPEWVEQLQIVYAEKMQSNGITFEIHADKSLKQVIADKKLINQVIMNLVNNAIDAVNEKNEEKKIEIQIMANRQNRILIKVGNNGPAIPEELLDKIFVPFFTTKPNGSGVGLSISQEIMRLHKGSLAVISGPDDHTVFIMEI